MSMTYAPAIAVGVRIKTSTAARGRQLGRQRGVFLDLVAGSCAGVLRRAGEGTIPLHGPVECGGEPQSRAPCERLPRTRTVETQHRRLRRVRTVVWAPRGAVAPPLHDHVGDARD